MKHKLLSALLVASAMITAFPVDAGSIGRSSSSSSSGSRSSYSSPSRSSYTAPAPSRPSVAPAPSKPGGIGGTSGSMGVRKSEVTAPVANKVQQSRPTPAPAPSTTPGYSNPIPTYGAAPAPVYQSSGSPFLSSMGGAFAGSMLGNMMFSGNRGGGTTVVNNGGGTGGVAASSGDGYTAGGPVVQAKSYGIGDFILDVILFAVLVALLVGLAFLAYKGYKMIKAYVNKERGVTGSQPFSPTAQFWVIQNAFASAEVALLKTILGPDLVDEATRDLQPSTLTLSKVSHEVVLNNAHEFSVHYTFVDDGDTVDQVWHYELHDGIWKLNGIETV